MTRKGRTRFLVETIKDIFAEQQEERDRALMSRVTRESALERRLATQLIRIRQEKDILIQNRIRLNNEFEEQRLKKYSEYLDREAEVLRIQKNTERDQFNAKMAEHQRSKFISFFLKITPSADFGLKIYKLTY